MTDFLVQIDDAQDFALAYKTKAEILLLTDWQKQAALKAFLQKYNDYAPKIWLYVEKASMIETPLKDVSCLQKIVISLAEADKLPSLDFYNNLPLVLMVDLYSMPDKAELEALKAKKLKSIIIGCKDKKQQLLNAQNITQLGQFFHNLAQVKIKAGILGYLQAPDIPRLLPFFPQYIGCKVLRPIKKGYFGDEAFTGTFRMLLPAKHDKQSGQGGVLPHMQSKCGTDRIIVEDFILPMEIGAYQHEYGQKQNVRFNIKADIKRLSANPEDMSHIFSYDIILDGIRNIVALGHVVLVETLAEKVAAFILAYPLVEKVVVRVEKLELGPKAVGIEIKRKKKKNQQ